MKRYIIDTDALVAYLNGSESGKPVLEVLKKTVDGSAESLISALNFGELYYHVLREEGVLKAESCLKLICEYPIEVMDVHKGLALEAARIKAESKMSYVNSVTAALAKHKKAILVTGDKEFKAVEKGVPIIWI